MKNCEYYEELIGAALDGEITAEEDKELRAHLESCEACRSFYEAMQAISGTDDALGDVPEDFTANVMARVRETAAPAEKPAKKKAGIARLVTRYGALAAAAAVADLGGSDLFRHFRREGREQHGEGRVGDRHVQRGGGQCRNGNPGGSTGSARRRQDDGRRAG